LLIVPYGRVERVQNNRFLFFAAFLLKTKYYHHIHSIPLKSIPTTKIPFELRSTYISFVIYIIDGFLNAPKILPIFKLLNFFLLLKNSVLWCDRNFSFQMRTSFFTDNYLVDNFFKNVNVPKHLIQNSN